MRMDRASRGLGTHLTMVMAGMVGVVLGMFTPACDQADEVFDCQSVCSRYKSCFDANYDVGNCRSRCRDKSDADKDFRNKANACEACIDDRSCSSATFSCATECVGIVP